MKNLIGRSSGPSRNCIDLNSLKITWRRQRRGQKRPKRGTLNKVDFTKNPWKFWPNTLLTIRKPRTARVPKSDNTKMYRYSAMCQLEDISIESSYFFSIYFELVYQNLKKSQWEKDFLASQTAGIWTVAIVSPLSCW